MKKHLLLLLGALVALPTMARDFDYTYAGQTITYTVLDEAAKTCQIIGTVDSNGGHPKTGNNITGALVLPENPSDGENVYTLTTLGRSAFERCSGLLSVSIPNTVTEIDRGAFYMCGSLKSVTLSNSLLTINLDAFYDCPSLTSITLPNSLISIGDRAFYGCESLAEITIPENVVFIGNSAFYACTLMKKVVFIAINCGVCGEDYLVFNPTIEEVEIGDKVRLIPRFAFEKLRGLKRVTIPDSVIKIDEFGFWGCSNLEDVTFGHSLTTIGGAAFATCTGLTSIVLPESVTNIDKEAFYQCYGLTSVTMGSSVAEIGYQAFAYDENLTEINLPNSLINIDTWAFSYCTGLTEITIPENVKSIGRWAFDGCDNLKKVNFNAIDCVSCGGILSPFEGVETVVFGDKVKIIPENAFAFCNLTSVTFGNSIAEIGSGAFRYCTALTEIALPNTLSKIGEYAFVSCGGLTELTIPQSVTEIGRSAFLRCSGLTELMIPKSVAEIGEGAFAFCTGLTAINVAPENSKFVSESGVLYTKDMTKLIQYPLASERTRFDIPNSVTEICTTAFGVSVNLTDITIPASVTTIGDYALQACDGLTSIAIPNSVTKIGKWAFGRCQGLTEVAIPATVAEIGDGAFGGCKNLTSITVSPDNRNYVSDNGVLFTKNMKKLIQYPAGNEQPKYVIPATVTELGVDAFSGCSRIASLTIPASINELEGWAFSSCSGLTAVTYLSDDPVECGEYVFPTEVYENATLNYLKSAEAEIASTEPWSLFNNRIGRDADFDSITAVRTPADTQTAVYNMQGVRVGTSTDGLPHGVYILRRGSTTSKISI